MWVGGGEGATGVVREREGGGLETGGGRGGTGVLREREGPGDRVGVEGLQRERERARR